MPEEQRVIFHCDCNSFYASVELLRYPELRGVPVAVCGSPDDRHGIILAKNEPAKRYGVQTAETVWSALRKCPGLKLLPPHHGQYREMSRAVNAIYARQYTNRGGRSRTACAQDADCGFCFVRRKIFLCGPALRIVRRRPRFLLLIITFCSIIQNT